MYSFLLSILLCSYSFFTFISVLFYFVCSIVFLLFLFLFFDLYFFFFFFFFFSSRRRHTRCGRDWSSDVCSSDLFRLFSTPGGYPWNWNARPTRPWQWFVTPPPSPFSVLMTPWPSKWLMAFSRWSPFTSLAFPTRMATNWAAGSGRCKTGHSAPLPTPFSAAFVNTAKACTEAPAQTRSTATLKCTTTLPLSLRTG